MGGSLDVAYLPEFALLIAGVFLAGAAIYALFQRRWIRALQFGGIGAACVSLAVFAGTSGWLHRAKDPRFPHGQATALRPANDSGSARDSDPQTTTLVLGGIPVQVKTADRYVLTKDGKTFLTLDSLATGLRVDCVIAGDDDPYTHAPQVVARIQDNLVRLWGSGVSTTKHDASTLVVRGLDGDLLRVRYGSPRTIEVDGAFIVGRDREAEVVRFAKGLTWRTGAVLPGGSVDLRPQGAGRIEFAESGAIEVVGESEPSRRSASR